MTAQHDAQGLLRMPGAWWQPQHSGLPTRLLLNTLDTLGVRFGGILIGEQRAF